MADAPRRRAPRRPRSNPRPGPALVNRVLALVLGARPTVPGSTRRLDALFRDLASPRPARDPEELVELIWALWIAHDDKDAASTMIAAVEAMDAGARDLARPILDRLVETYPDWPEAWNKRATLAFLDRRDGDALADIAETLAREPRHFGAILGFGQICLRAEQPREARAAFQAALRLNPHIDGLADFVAHLDGARQTLH